MKAYATPGLHGSEFLWSPVTSDFDYFLWRVYKQSGITSRVHLIYVSSCLTVPEPHYFPDCQAFSAMLKVIHEARLVLLRFRISGLLGAPLQFFRLVCYYQILPRYIQRLNSSLIVVLHRLETDPNCFVGFENLKKEIFSGNSSETSCIYNGCCDCRFYVRCDALFACVINEVLIIPLNIAYSA